KIPDVYLNRRWTKNVLPTHLLDKRHRYGPSIEETDTLASQLHHTIEECISLFRNETDKLSELLSTIQDLKKKLKTEMQIPRVDLNKDDLYSDLLDVTVPDKVVIKTPKSIFRSRGMGKNVVVDDEDAGDTDDQFDDEALGNNSTHPFPFPCMSPCAASQRYQLLFPCY
nr:FAR1 DNA binding domain-containing protein [Tanacetum cinerariifolium]